MPTPARFGFHTGYSANSPTDPHHVVRPDGLDVWTLEYCVSGRAAIYEKDKIYYLNPGEFHLIPAAIPQHFEMDPQLKQWTHYWVAFTPRESWHEGLLVWPRYAGYFMKLAIPEGALRARLHERIVTAYEIGQGPLHRRELFAMNIVEEILLWCETVNPLSKDTLLDVRIHQAAQYLCSHMEDQLCVRQLAEMIHLSPSRFTHLFREQLGQSPMQYLETRRVDHARTLLIISSLPVADIAEACGYATPSYFDRVFKRHTGTTPHVYRATHHV